MQGHILEEWRIQRVEQDASQAVRRLYELDALRNDVARLECTVRELGTENVWLRNQVETLTNQVSAIETAIEEWKEQSK